jgi:hypothetical protein
MISYTILPRFKTLNGYEVKNAKCELKEVINGFGRSRITALDVLYGYSIAISLESDLKETAKAILAVEFKA